MRLSDMWDGAEIKDLPAWRSEAPVRGVTCDSRKVAQGFLFAAIPGLTHDGRDFIPDALDRGAVAVLAPPGTRLPDAYQDIPLLETDNPRRRYALSAARFYRAQPKTIAAVTGTNGKTSVVHFLRQIWTRSGRRAASAGTLGIQSPVWQKNEGLTTPDPADLHADLKHLAELGVDHLAIEASSHGLDQFRLDGLEIAAAAFTNLTRDHLDYHGTEGAYLAAKLRLFQKLINENGTAVVCADDPHAAAVIDACWERGLSILTFGREGEVAHIKALSPEGAGQRLMLDLDGWSHEIFLPLAGAFQALNVLCALLLARATGVDGEEALAAIGRIKGVPGRMELIGAKPAKKGTAGTVYVDYAHTPDALENILTALRPHAEKSLAVVFGCGGDRDRGKRPEMGRIAANLAGRVIVTDDNPRSEDPAAIRAEILAAAKGAREIGDRAEAIETAVGELGPGDVLVIAGKGHERGQIISGRTEPFDDREQAREALRRHGWTAEE
ncbi:MAG: UDP-N-acetylmuramoyl-L-alanyl-D-glutamate--2,6-diaminopimelate ligase [Rhodospirillaceae bacterium]